MSCVNVESKTKVITNVSDTNSASVIDPDDGGTATLRNVGN
jgi:hypothetical protein